jgi:putative protease
MKFTIIPKSIKSIEKYKKIGANAFIFALKDYSCGYEGYYSLDDIKKIKNDYKDIEIFVSLNKNFFNEELDNLKEILIELDKLNIDGVLFYDMAVLSIRNNLNLNLPLVWNQTHMVTNYNTCNYYYDKGVNYGVLSKEITIDEINEINSKTKMKLMTNIFCYPLMSYTRRSLITNYFKAHKIDNNKSKYIIVNNDEEYIINEEENGTGIYHNKLLNGSDIITVLETPYAILNDSFIDEKLFSKVLELYIKLYNSKDDNIKKEIDDLVGDYRAFFNTKTIYKVKKNG